MTVTWRAIIKQQRRAHVKAGVGRIGAIHCSARRCNQLFTPVGDHFITHCCTTTQCRGVFAASSRNRLLAVHITQGRPA